LRQLPKRFYHIILIVISAVHTRIDSSRQAGAAGPSGHQGADRGKERRNFEQAFILH
jgi:hypothetical protein